VRWCAAPARKASPVGGETYRGPVIDAHHHLWDLRLERHAWLDWPKQGDELAPLRRNYLVEDYLEASSGSGIVASVHVEANWDPTDPLGETEWLDGLERPAGIAARYVAFAALASDNAQEIIERQAGHERVAGIREIISWHPDPAKARVEGGDLMEDARWRAGLTHVQSHGLSFDLLISSRQLDMAWRLARDFPDMQFVLNHCGSPMDRDAEGMDHWRASLRRLAAAENVSLKISDPVAYDPAWTRESLAGVILHCIDCFGAGRCMFASDYPVAGLHITFDHWRALFSDIVADLSKDEKRSLFFDNARKIYRIPV